MIDQSDRISEFPPKFNELEMRVKILEEKIMRLQELVTGPKKEEER